MTPTERIAYDWLVKQGCTRIEHNSSVSPDFFTDQGNFEVKLATRSKAIMFKRKQIEKLKTTNSTILIFSKDSTQPSAIIEAKNLESQIEQSGFYTQTPPIGKQIVTVEIPDELEIKLRMKALKVFGGRKGSLQKAIEQALSEWVK